MNICLDVYMCVYEESYVHMNTCIDICIYEYEGLDVCICAYEDV